MGYSDYLCRLSIEEFDKISGITDKAKILGEYASSLRQMINIVLGTGEAINSLMIGADTIFSYISDPAVFLLGAIKDILDS